MLNNQNISQLEQQIFAVNEQNFTTIALKVFQFQAQNNAVYKKYLESLNINPLRISSLNKIPFLPIEFFKSHKIVSGCQEPEICFLSSATTSGIQSKHYVLKQDLYYKSFKKCFELFYGDISNYVVLALLPSYLEREGSSLILMAEDLIKNSNSELSGFFLNNHTELIESINKAKQQQKKILLLGVSFALLDLAENHQLDLSDVIIMETGGMKGKRKELVREELHQLLCESFKTKAIHSEYGMTELLSQAYSKGNGIFETPPWMRVLIRETTDPFHFVENEKTGGINVIDLANLYSCSFIATQDLGKSLNNKKFSVLGRFDNSDVRGCNLMVM
ncbi:MAG: acyl transferase [Bacteroidota bacterium]